MTDRVYQRARRASSKDKGLCCECVCRPRVAGLSRCETCRKRIEDRRRTARVKRKTLAVDTFRVCCQSHEGHRIDCSELVGTNQPTLNGAV